MQVLYDDGTWCKYTELNKINNTILYEYKWLSNPVWLKHKVYFCNHTATIKFRH